ncbi:MAG: Iron-sulfur cluster assembly, partial [Pseudomonadota bacterium]
DIEALARALEENYPDEDIAYLSLNNIEDLVLALSDFEDDPEDVTDRSLQLIKEEWANFRDKVA